MTINGLSGNEIFCLEQKHYQVANVVFGNSLYSAGFIKGLGSVTRDMPGKELKEATALLSQARGLAFERLLANVNTDEYAGLIKVSNEWNDYPGYVEFLSAGTKLKTKEKKQKFFSATVDGQDLYALLDAGFIPLHAAFGSIVYAMGSSAPLFRSLKNLARGEITEYSAVLNETRNHALEHAINNAKKYDANALLGIKTIFFPVGRACEMVLAGTACQHHFFDSNEDGMMTSHLSNIEMWNLAKLGYVPLRMVLSSVVFSLGINTHVKSMLKSMIGSENNELTKMIAESREKALHHLDVQAKARGGEIVAGVRTYICPLGNGLVEFLAMGTTLKKSSSIKTTSEQLPVQIAITDQFKVYDYTGTLSLDNKENTPFGALMRVILLLIIILALVWLALKNLL